MSKWLGVDIGTTSLKVSLIDKEEQEICCTSEDFEADITSSFGETGFEQCPKTIIEVIDRVVVPLLASYINDISAIGITGQMHGILLWKRTNIKTGLQEQAPDKPDFDSKSVQKFTLCDQLSAYETSNLYTWQDQRCTPSFLASLPQTSDPHQPLATGHGCATLFWLLRHQRLALEEVGYNCCGTIMDFLTCLLCDLGHPVTSDQLATSMGYFQSDKTQWDSVLRNTPEFPYHMLPSVVEAGTIIGHVSEKCKGWSAGAPVFVAMGDVQCAMYSLTSCPNSAIVNIGTSIQLGFLARSCDVSKLRDESPASISFFPFFRPHHLALCAGLNGGNAVQHFARCLSRWMVDLGCREGADTTDTNTILAKLQTLAEENSAQNQEDGDNDDGESQTAPRDDLSIQPSFFGERHAPTMGGSISGISLVNFHSVGHVFKRLCEGIITHLCSMVPASYLKTTMGLDRLSVCGSVPAKNRFVREAIALMYGANGLLDVEIAPGGSQRETNSAKGAARIVKDCTQR